MMANVLDRIAADVGATGWVVDFMDGDAIDCTDSVRVVAACSRVDHCTVHLVDRHGRVRGAMLIVNDGPGMSDPDRIADYTLDISDAVTAAIDAETAAAAERGRTN
jgi:hypothetical protein